LGIERVIGILLQRMRLVGDGGIAAPIPTSPTSAKAGESDQDKGQGRAHAK